MTPRNGPRVQAAKKPSAAGALPQYRQIPMIARATKPRNRDVPPAAAESTTPGHHGGCILIQSSAPTAIAPREEANAAGSHGESMAMPAMTDNPGRKIDSSSLCGHTSRAISGPPNQSASPKSRNDAVKLAAIITAVKTAVPA